MLHPSHGLDRKPEWVRTAAAAAAAAATPTRRSADACAQVIYNELVLTTKNYIRTVRRRARARRD